LTRTRLALIFGGVAAAAVVAGVITAFAIAHVLHDDALSTSSLAPVTLVFCEPLREPGAASTKIAAVADGALVSYAPGGCQPDIDASGAVAVRNVDGSIGRETPTYAAPSATSRDNIVWTPGNGTLNGNQVIMNGHYLKHDAKVMFDTLGAPLLTFSMTDDGQQVFGSMSERLIGYPIATFVDGKPLRSSAARILAPTIQARITDSGQFTGLTLDDAKRLAVLIDNGLAH
jgi:preprotein translocase subunit SecD